MRVPSSRPLRRRLSTPVLLALAMALPAAPAGAAPAAAVASGKPAGVAAAARTARPAASDVWMAEAPPGAPHGAVYLTLRNGPRADVLESIQSPVCAVAELHTLQQSGGVLRMRPEPGLALAPGATVVMAPGGRHIMLINLKRTLAVGEKVPLTLRFRKAGDITVQAEVRARDIDGSGAPDAHAHHHH